jgi:hypothetical protein
MAEVYRATGRAFYEVSGEYRIDVGSVGDARGSDGRPLVGIIDDSLFVPIDNEWRETRAAALRDARAKIEQHIESLRKAVAAIDSQVGAMEPTA